MLFAVVVVLALGGTIRCFGFWFPDVRSDEAILQVFFPFPMFVLMKQFSKLFLLFFSSFVLVSPFCYVFFMFFLFFSKRPFWLS